MSISAQTVMDRAIQRSAMNNPDLVPPAQMLGYLSTNEKAAFIAAAKRNPDFFGKSGTTATRSVYTAGWDLTSSPGDVGIVSLIEVAAISGSVTGVSVGDKVSMVSLRWPQLALSPRGYIRGHTIYGYQSELGADNSNLVTQLTVHYSELPASITDVDTYVSLPDEWVDLLVLPLARILAIRDGRPDEAKLLQEEYQMLFELFLEQVATYDHGAVRPLQAVPAASRPPSGGM